MWRCRNVWTWHVWPIARDLLSNEKRKYAQTRHHTGQIPEGVGDGGAEVFRASTCAQWVALLLTIRTCSSSRGPCQTSVTRDVWCVILLLQAPPVQKNRNPNLTLVRTPVITDVIGRRRQRAVKKINFTKIATRLDEGKNGQVVRN